jgi:osmotically-inducible protein OsmY
MKKNLNTLTVLLLVFFFSAAMIGCQSKTSRMTEKEMNDKALALAVNSKLTQDPLLKDMPIGVACYRQEITLSGAVNTPMQKNHAEQIARAVPGVRDVNNLLMEP